jgi:hypothetical protein
VRAPPLERRTRLIAVMLFGALFAFYNANGREIGTVDSQPAKFTAREVAVRGTLRLDRIVAERPALAERAAFARDRQGHFRSAYPLPSALIAAIPATLVHHLGLVDMDAPLAPNLVAKLTASVLTATAVTLIFLSVRRIVSETIAVITAIAIGLGTNYWAVVSQTLWLHESVAFGLAMTLWAWLRPAGEIRGRDLWLGGIGLALAGAARPQIAPLVGVMIGWLVARAGMRQGVVPALVVSVAAIASIATNYYWFGHLLGGTAALEAMHPATHGVEGSISATPWVGALGLLVSPSRGVLLFSPIVVAGFLGPGRQQGAAGLALQWLAAGVAIQYGVYALYSVWWGGHTYGPRYMMDVIVPFAPALAFGLVRMTGTGWGRIVAGALLVWSILVAGRGAFVYPNDAWNTNPAEVDREHHRLWDVRDSQLVRVFRSGASPQNFSLFSEGAIRRPAS